MKRNALLLQIAALCALAATDAFVSPRFTRTTSCATVARVPATSLLVASDSTNETASNNISDDRSSSSSSWTLEQDWALMDAVPKFTVGGDSDQIRTFWTQLVLQTPALRDKLDGPLDGGGAEDELMARYQFLRDENSSKENNAALPPSGRAPPVLQRWNLDETTGRMQGEVDGRMIWVQMQTMGQFNNADYSFQDTRRKKGIEEMRSAPPPGGYVEAVGGRVYELGEPAKQTAICESPSDNIPLMKNISTVLASAVLAVAIIGLVGPPQPALLQQQASLSTQPKTDNAIVQLQVKRRDVIEINNSEQSIGERRARLEAKILRDARVVKTLKETLQRDEEQLAALKLQKSSASAVSDDAEQTSMQQRISRIEARVGRTERVVDAISKRLPEERIELRKLRQLEAIK